MDIDSFSDSDLIKEVYARFGLAYYLSECLHKSLCIIYVMSSFEQPSEMTKPRIEELLSYSFSRTLGQIIRELADRLDHELYLELEGIINKRNFLAHHFWFEKVHLMYSNKGLDEIISELDDCKIIFEEIDERIISYYEKLRMQFGLTDDIILKEYDKIKSGQEFEPLHKIRKLKKSERLVKVWDVAFERGIGLVFEFVDGTLWQLCDIGFGWSLVDQVGSDWEENIVFRDYLPVNINPRPSDFAPWNYEINLSSSAKLWVRRSGQDRKTKWGISTKSH